MELLAQTAPTSRWVKAGRTVGPILLVIGIIVFVVARFTGNGGEAPSAAQFAPTEAKVDQGALTPAARDVAEKFVMTAVTGKDPGAAWPLLDRTFPGKSDFRSQRQWAAAAKGEGLPLVPAGYAFDKDGVKITVNRVFPNSLDLTVVIIPNDRKNQRAKGFDLSLVRHGSGDRTRWLVDYWMTNYVSPVRGEPK